MILILSGELCRGRGATDARERLQSKRRLAKKNNLFLESTTRAAVLLGRPSRRIWVWMEHHVLSFPLDFKQEPLNPVVESLSIQ
jgi:hypothetical protein